MGRLRWLAALALAAGCGSRDTGAAPPDSGIRLTEIPLAGGETVVVAEDRVSSVTTVSLEGMRFLTDGVAIGFRPRVVRTGQGVFQGEIRISGTVYGQIPTDSPGGGESVLPVVEGTPFIRLIGGETLVTFFREQASVFLEEQQAPGEYRFEAVFSLEPPVMEQVLGSGDFALAGDNPGWRVAAGDSQLESLRMFLEYAMAGPSHSGGPETGL
jgi:hypothetical protein